MKKSRLFLILGILMYIFAVCFLWIVFNHPEWSLNIPTIFFHMINFTYAIVGFLMFVLFGIFGTKERRANKKRITGVVVTLSVFALLALPIYYFITIRPLL